MDLGRRLGGVHDSSALLQALFANSPVPYMVFDPAGHPVVGNQAYRSMFGVEPPPAYCIFDDEVAAALGLHALVRRAFAGETVETQPFWYDPKQLRHVQAPEAKRVAIACTFFPLLNASGAVAYVAVAYREVTAEFAARERAEAERDRLQRALAEREHLAEALRESEERLRHTLDAAEVGTWQWNIPANSVEWSPNIERIFGLAPGTFGGTYDDWLALVHPDDRASIGQRVARSLETLAPYAAEFRFVRPDGSTGWQNTLGYVISDEQGRPKLLRGIVMDVTARRLAEEALKMPAQVLESMTEGVSLTDEQGVILYTNPAEDRMFGYERGGLRGRHVSVQNAYPPEENQRRVADVIAQLKARGEWTGEWSNRKKDGTPFITRARITALDLDGKPHWVCVQHDVTEELEARQRAKQLSDSLRESEARYRAFVAQSTEGIWRIEVETPVPTRLPADEQVEAFYASGYLAECNDAMARMYGFTRADELHGKRLGEFLVRSDRRNHAYLAAFIDSGYRLDGAESHEVDRDGRRRIFRNSLFGVIEDGKLLRAWGTQRDVTAEVEAREAAEAASRAKDEFFAVLGHELRNPLSPILTALELMKLRDANAFAKERAIVERQLKHVVRLVDDLLDVARMTQGKVSLDRQRVDLADAVAAGIELASPLIEERAHRLSVDVPRGLVVDGDPTRLGQVFSNLLTNAAKYTPARGAIAVTAEARATEVSITVSDTGIGIRPEILPTIFEMFVQERQAIDRAGGGLGLGLAIVRTLVSMHGGKIHAASEGLDKGSQFSVTLPRVHVIGTPVVDAPRSPSPPRPDGWRVLVVDDNVEAADLLAEALAMWGHTVRVAHDAPAALGVLERFVPDVALLDVGLPVMDGYELARRLRGDPALSAVRLIAVTGYGRPKDRAASTEAGFDAHLVKPIDLASLESELSRVMKRNGRDSA